jgi:hypothetical protein
LPIWTFETQVMVKRKVKESNWQFDSRSLKVGNWHDTLACRWRATYCWKALNKGYNIFLDLITIKGLHVRLCASKIVKVLYVGILRLPFGSPKTKSHLDVAPVKRRRVYYKGEGGGFPQVRAMVSLVNPRSHVARLSTKWRTPKLRIRLKMSLSGSNNGIVRSSRHAPSSQH